MKGRHRKATEIPNKTPKSPNCIPCDIDLHNLCKKGRCRCYRSAPKEHDDMKGRHRKDE